MIPRGTGWDFVRTYGIPRKLEDAVEVALRGRTREIDLGRARYRGWDGSRGESLFANIASAGMSGAIAKRANETSKALGGKASYLVGDARRLLALAATTRSRAGRRRRARAAACTT